MVVQLVQISVETNQKISSSSGFSSGLHWASGNIIADTQIFTWHYIQTLWIYSLRHFEKQIFSVVNILSIYSVSNSMGIPETTIF